MSVLASLLHPAYELATDSGEEIAAFLIRRLVILQGQPTPGGSVILSGDDLLAIATELEGHHG
jgi:hypothetical protein